MVGGLFNVAAAVLGRLFYTAPIGPASVGGGGGGGSSSSNTRGRIRASLVGVCILVLLALVFNVMMSANLSTTLEEEMTEGESELPAERDDPRLYHHNATAATTTTTTATAGTGSALTDGGGTTDPNNNISVAITDGSVGEDGVAVVPTPAYTNSSTTATSNGSPGDDANDSNHQDEEPFVPYTYNSTLENWFHSYKDTQLQMNPDPLPPLNKDAKKAFKERWCDLSNLLEEEEWWPQQSQGQSNSKFEWMTRAPSVLIPGAKYGGTDVVAQLLQQHPLVASQQRHAELNFFYNRNFGARYVSPLTEKTKVHAARQRFYAASQFDSSLRAENSKLIAFDATPSYLFYSSLLPRRILCVLPWIRLVVVLRNPVDRVLAQFRHAQQYQNLRLPLETWLQREFHLLDQVGYNTTSVQKGGKSQQEQDVAWYEYLQRTVDGAIGRSIYDIQLRQWFQALRAVGRLPSQSVYVVLAEDLLAQPQVELDRIAKFLKLDTGDNANFNFQYKSILSSSSLQPIQPTDLKVRKETYEHLQEYFDVYNKRLRNLLRRYEVKTSG